MARIEAARSVTTAGQLADEYFERMIIRTKTGQPLDIPMPTMAVEWLPKLKELACNAAYVLPARRRRALEAWGQLLLKLERQGPHPKKPAPAHQQASLPQEG
ncbi:MAG: hypothetical protein NTV19_16640 [Burkholderiales bacterium]|nr:hypothetical protein [Burkholderiales bacterium]